MKQKQIFLKIFPEKAKLGTVFALSLSLSLSGITV
jgi:hypothetical protein